MGEHETLFGKIWTYEELLTVERTRGGRSSGDAHLAFPERPAFWPSNADVDRETKWVFWLPEGWAQAVSITVSGKSQKCYISPEGKRFWHKKDIEKFLGRMLEAREPPEVKDSGEKVGKLVTDPDAIPTWPDGEWLPKDWRVCFRQLPSTLHKIFIPPGQDDGFCYHRSTVMDYLAGKQTALSPFGSSRSQTERSADAVSGAPKERSSKRRKLERGDGGIEVSPEDYEEGKWLSLTPLQTQGSEEAARQKLAAAGAPDAKEFAKAGLDIYGLLLKRGFPKETEVLALLGRDAAASHWLSKQLCGIYYQMADAFHDRPCYQKVSKSPELASSSMFCQPMYIFWSAENSSWKVGALKDSKAGWAFSDEDKARPGEVSGPWMLLREGVLEKGG